MTKLQQFRAADAQDRAAASHLLFSWLCDDQSRGELYDEINAAGGFLKFQSRADRRTKFRPQDDSVFNQDAYLFTGRDQILEAMTNRDDYSNSPFKELGSGTFMLALDGGEHRAQRDFAGAYLRYTDTEIAALTNLAFKAGALLALKRPNFDLAELAEQVALRYMGFLFGFEQADHALLENTMRRAYRGLSYLMFARHFVSEPFTVDDASRAMGELLVRATGIIEVHRSPIGTAQKDAAERLRLEHEELQSFEDSKGNRPLKDFAPVLMRIGMCAKAPHRFSGAELGVIVVGLVSGAIGNIQAAISIAINEFLGDKDRWELAREAAKSSYLQSHDYSTDAETLGYLVWEALRLNPPASFLPRKVASDGLKLDGNPVSKGSLIVLGVGGATRGPGPKFRPKATDKDAIIFGNPGEKPGLHSCMGQLVTMPMAIHAVRQILLLPGFNQTYDPRTGDVQRLEKLWGYNCTRYPLEYARNHALIQSPLIVMMRVKSPTTEHAEKLKKVIQYGAPRIEKKLRDSGHVHFASFVFIENDSKLALYTVYDGDFDAYIEHFALEIGPLFDRLFEHIEDAPPTPVSEFPKEFVDTIRRFNVRPAGNYFFSAYPRVTCAMVTNQFRRKGE
jgi:cytochrome P450